MNHRPFLNRDDANRRNRENEIEQDRHAHVARCADTQTAGTILSNLQRCDGLLPKLTRMPNGAEGILWSVDCPQRETCARFVAFERDIDTGFNGDPSAHRTYLAASHGTDEACPTFVQHTEGGE